MEIQGPLQAAAREPQRLKALHHLLRYQRRNLSVGMPCERLYRVGTFTASWILIPSEVHLLRLHRRNLMKSTYTPSEILPSMTVAQFNMRLPLTNSQLTVAISHRFMIPGVLNDDRYRMVEDEFLHIAQRFTAHLHRAEYDRLKALAKAQNADTIREIERPIVPDTVPTARTRQRSASRQRALKQRKALAAAGRGEEDRKAKDDGAKSLVAATGLRGLMEAPRHEGIATPGLSKPRAVAIAATTTVVSKEGQTRTTPEFTLSLCAKQKHVTASSRFKFKCPRHVFTGHGLEGNASNRAQDSRTATKSPHSGR
ncbi:hypothetical protein M419DRAFT_32829 [Trichoderma reesei RUT C-30]|uniref:Uncharacterized protein n=1 Tax=Hypocrea jecorina (strain ATCC 56765 / BCRC 32924 / NRRL 11460 / Rut C-30) TaxID=1344414 RepID=A0A024SI75_HYPJR|nr:hypothetical protein M419DRAFT_32829 [Trichoderma reesei RUT C-30]